MKRAMERGRRALRCGFGLYRELARSALRLLPGRA